MPAKASKKTKSKKAMSSMSAKKSMPMKMDECAPFFTDPMHMFAIGAAVVIFAMIVVFFMSYGASMQW